MRYSQPQGTGLHKDSGTFKLSTSTKRKQRSYISKKRWMDSWTGKTQKSQEKPKLETEFPLDLWIQDTDLKTHDLLIYINHLQRCFFISFDQKYLANSIFFPCLIVLVKGLNWLQCWVLSFPSIKYAWTLQSLMLYLHTYCYMEVCEWP